MGSRFNRNVKASYSYKKWADWNVDDEIIGVYRGCTFEEYKGVDHQRHILKVLESNVFEEGQVVKLSASTVINGMIKDSGIEKGDIWGFSYAGEKESKSGSTYHNFSEFEDLEDSTDNGSEDI